MEESFGLTWEDSATVVQTEEVICGIENEILPAESEEFTGVAEEVTVEETPGTSQENVPIMYLSDGNVLVMQQGSDGTFQEQFIDCNEVTEEVVTEQWVGDCPEEIVIGSEEAVGDVEEQPTDDCEIPLPTDQDEYTAARPYPCDFCSRRFRKKANLMNHMVAHQTDRPHGCNLCGVRYIRKCDLMNHLKIHAYIPDATTFEEEEVQIPLDDEFDATRKRQKPSVFIKKRKKTKIKEEVDSADGDETGASSSRTYSYVDEDMRLMEAMANNKTEYAEYLQNSQGETRYPVTDPNKPFVCQHCGVGFAREKALASHARVHGGDSPFECQKCGEMFWDLALMREHLRNKHGDIDDFEEDDDEDADYSDSDIKYGTYYCPTCGLSFHRQDNLRRHQRIHVKEEFSNEHEFGHVCNVCGESFQEALDLLAHAEIHARGSEHRCMICGEICADDAAVAAHVQTKHGKTLPPNTCMLCGRTCKDRRTLLKHSWEHSKEKMYACSKCGKTFHNKARLKRHMLSHRNKVVNCDVCGEEFPDGRSLMNHRHSHSSVSGRQFPCRECGKTFGSRSSQQIHIRIHTGERPYGCRFCWKAFADGGTLRKHERIHTGEKPYACAVCPRAFNQRVVLREHIRSHHSGPDPKYMHSVTPYCCSVCSDMFATSQDLILHLIHHCDMNTAMKRQPQIGPRKYKRRRKLKPHELELITSRAEADGGGGGGEEREDQMVNAPPPIFSDQSDDEQSKRRKPKIKPQKNSPKQNLNDTYTDLYNSCSSAIENINSIVNSKPQSKNKKMKIKLETSVPSRPKMIHTQKTRVPIEPGEDGKVRHKTRTLVTRTQPTELKSATGERIRPRTKNVSYHVLNSDKLPLATFPQEDDTEQAVNNLLKQDMSENENHDESNGIVYMDTPEVAAEQTVEIEEEQQQQPEPEPVTLVKLNEDNRIKTRSSTNSLKPGRHIIGPAGKVVRLVKEGMIVSKAKKLDDNEPESILPDKTVQVKQELIKQEIIDPSPLHELAEISMQHAQNLFKCEMCSEVFTDRAQLLVHVPIHI